MSILEDSREIKSIYWEDEGSITVGRAGVTKIEAYGEPGQCTYYVPWFKIWEGDHLDQRINGATICGVVYKEQADENHE